MKDTSLRNIIFFGGFIILTGAVFCLCINPWCAMIFVISGSMMLGIFTWEINKRKEKLKQLNSYLSLVCAGHYELDISDNEEGEISILKNNLYKVIVLLRSQNTMLEKDKRFLADSLADISHQLKTPLTSMMVMTELLEKEKEEEKRKQFLQVVERQLEKMKWLITNLLKLSKLDAGTVEFHNVSIPLDELIHASVEPYLLMMDVRNISLKTDVASGSIQGDFNWTTEALGNIIKNCLEYMENGGNLEIQTRDCNLFQSVLIRDDGCGIDKEELPHIFERFYNGKKAKKDSIGIGLALAQTIIEREQGKILVKSELGKGTEFEIRFYKMIV